MIYNRDMTKSKRWLLLGGGILLALVVAAGGFLAWKRHVVKAQEQRSLQAATNFLTQGRGADALVVIQGRNRTTTRQTSEQKAQWQSLEIQALSQIGNLSRLFALYDHAPDLFAKEENASVQVGRAALHAGNYEAFDKLRERWVGKETRPSAWLELDADALLMRGKREEAIKLLNSRTFTGPDDCGRLARLALINTPSDLKAAWEYLDRAAKLDPRNSEIRVFRGQILESAGKRNAAQMEFQAAYIANTNSPYYRDQLAEFLRRNGSYDLAVLTWANGLTNAQTTDLIWLRTLFWTKTTRTIKFDFNAAKPPFGPLQPFVQYLIALPQGTFWDDAAFQKIAEARRFDQQLQETFWLRLLALLQTGKEDEATKLLEFNRFRTKSWQLDLESVLLRVLRYRKSGELKLPVGVNIALSSAPTKTRHQLLEQLDALTKDPKQPMPSDLEKLLRSKNAFSAVLLAFGWAEAALNLPHDDVVPTDLPEWLPYGLTQARRFNRGNAAALEFVSRQKSTPTLELLGGEILIADGKFDEGLRKLAALSAIDSDVGSRAAMRISETHLHLKQYEQARSAVESLPRLRDSVEGKQLLAHVALAQGKNEDALKIYTAIENESDEAKSFLARQAFFDRNWPRARKLTEDLLQKYPDNLQFHRNLDDIAKAEAAK
jgi:thioredoxin-like negative regulator of GroEL